MTDQTTRIWLCDLTYTQQTIASDIMPAGIGCIASYTLDNIGHPVEVRLFKHPEKLSNALDEQEKLPHIIAFSNYIWNRRLSAGYASVIKKHHPEIVTVFGGPNYPTRLEEQESFLRKHPMMDFYIVWEAEIAFMKLAKALIENNFNVSDIPDDLPSLHYIDDKDEFKRSELIERLWDLTKIPSPYLQGLMDEFFDGVLLPIIQTKRGCPFTCTFCVEGNSYYSRVAKTDYEKTDKEIRYIGDKMHELIKQGKGRTDMHISDSNFGMFKDDLLTCETISEIQDKYGYPEYINVATGKNHKKRVLEAAKLIKGALRLAGSVQSLDKDVLKNIKRSNIDEQGLMDLALEASEIDANSYTEVILGLPGDNLKAHFDTIKKVIEADFNNISLYQLMLLPGTDLASDESKQKWEMDTRYRALPRCYGYYDCLGEEVNTAEIEEICVSNNSLSFDDYLNCRKFHLITNVFYNDGVYKELLRFIKLIGLSKYDWLLAVYNYNDDDEFNGFVDEFIEKTRNELWTDRSEAENFTSDRLNLKKYVAGEYGSNLIFKYRSIALVKFVNAMKDVAKTTTEKLLSESGKAQYLDFALELIDFATLRMDNIFVDVDEVATHTFKYDVESFSEDLNAVNIEDYRLKEPYELHFLMAEEQKDLIRRFIDIYGNNYDGFSRILAKIYIRRLLRKTMHAGDEAASHDFLSSKEAAIGDGQLTGLNEFT